jgi:protein ImuA
MTQPRYPLKQMDFDEEHQRLLRELVLTNGLAERAGSGTEDTLLAKLRERIGRIEHPAATVFGALPYGIAAIDRALPGGGLARGASHEILGADGDEEDGALAPASAAYILGRLTGTADGMVLWRLPRPDLYGPGLAAHGLDPGRVMLVRALRDGEILWAMEEGLHAPGVVAVVGEVGTLPAVASRRLQLAAEHSGITAFLLRRWRDGARTQSAECGDDPMADRRIAVSPYAGRARGRAPAVADRAAPLPRRGARLLGNGGAGCDGSCISGCRAGRSTGFVYRSEKAPPRRLMRRRSRRSSILPGAVFSPR